MSFKGRFKKEVDKDPATGTYIYPHSIERPRAADRSQVYSELRINNPDATCGRCSAGWEQSELRGYFDPILIWICDDCLYTEALAKASRCLKERQHRHNVRIESESGDIHGV